MLNNQIQLLVDHNVGVFGIINYGDMTTTTGIVEFEVNNGNAVLLL